MHSDFYELFHRFWWLIFPILGMGMGMIGMWQRHARANRTIDVIRAYAEQGKDPPAELLAALRDPDFAGRGRKPATWTSVLVFAALAVGLVMFSFVSTEGDIEAMAAFLFAALIMAAICVGKLLTLMSEKKHDGKPQQ